MRTLTGALVVVCTASSCSSTGGGLSGASGALVGLAIWSLAVFLAAKRRGNA
jgi:hypothetical protein